jgi:hypothetical protein
MKPFLSLLFLTLPLILNAVPPATYEAVTGEPFWLEADVSQQFPTEPIIRSTDYVKQGSTYFASPGEKTQTATAWMEVSGLWLEPRKAAETAKPDNMVLSIKNTGLEVMGADGKAIDTTNPGTILPEGSTVTVKEGWAAVTLGGVNTLHLMPNTTATLSMKPEAGKLSTTIMLKSGGVFSKVGKREGLVQDYRIKTPQGVAAARGTDYVTLALPTRMEVWIAEGVVDVLDNQGAKVGQVAAASDHSLKVLRNPPIPDPVENAKANAAIMSAAFGFVGQANIDLQAIQSKKTKGETLSAQEEAQLKETLPVSYLVKVHKTN